MDTVQHQLQQFHEFALARLGGGGSAPTLEELFDEWRLKNPAPEEHHENCKAVAASVKDFDNGERGIAADKFMEAFRSRNAVE